MEGSRDLPLRLYEREYLRHLNPPRSLEPSEAAAEAARALQHMGFSAEACDIAVQAFSILRLHCCESSAMVLNPRALKPFDRRLLIYLIRAQAERFRGLLRHLEEVFPEVTRFVLFGTEDVLLMACVTEPMARELDAYLDALQYAYTTLEVEKTHLLEGFDVRDPAAGDDVDQESVNALIRGQFTAVSVKEVRRLVECGVLLGRLYDEDFSTTGRLRAFVDVTLNSAAGDLRVLNIEFLACIRQLPQAKEALRSIHVCKGMNRLILDVVCDDLRTLWQFASDVRNHAADGLKGLQVGTQTHLVAHREGGPAQYGAMRSTAASLLTGLHDTGLFARVQLAHGETLNRFAEGFFGLAPKQRFALIALMVAVEEYEGTWLRDTALSCVRDAVQEIAVATATRDLEKAASAVATLAEFVESFLRDSLKDLLSGLFRNLATARTELKISAGKSFSRFGLLDSLNALRSLHKADVGRHLGVNLREITDHRLDQMVFFRNPAVHRNIDSLGWADDPARMTSDAYEVVDCALRILAGVERDLVHICPLEPLADPPPATLPYMDFIKARPRRGVLLAERDSDLQGNRKAEFWSVLAGLNHHASHRGQRGALLKLAGDLADRAAEVTKHIDSAPRREELSYITAYMVQHHDSAPPRLIADYVAIPLFYCDTEAAAQWASECSRELPDSPRADKPT